MKHKLAPHAAQQRKAELQSLGGLHCAVGLAHSRITAFRPNVAYMIEIDVGPELADFRRHRGDDVTDIREIDPRSQTPRENRLARRRVSQ